jgi:hypothetical protein
MADDAEVGVRIRTDVRDLDNIPKAGEGVKRSLGDIINSLKKLEAASKEAGEGFSSFGQVSSRLQELVEVVGKFGSVGGSIAAASAGFAAFGGAALVASHEIKEFVESQGELLLRMHALAEASDISTQQIVGLKTAFASVGVGSETFQRIMQRTAVFVGRAWEGIKDNIEDSADKSVSGTNKLIEAQEHLVESRDKLNKLSTVPERERRGDAYNKELLSATLAASEAQLKINAITKEVNLAAPAKDISTVAEALKNVGVAIEDTTGKFKDGHKAIDLSTVSAKTLLETIAAISTASGKEPTTLEFFNKMAEVVQKTKGIITDKEWLGALSELGALPRNMSAPGFLELLKIPGGLQRTDERAKKLDLYTDEGIARAKEERNVTAEINQQYDNSLQKIAEWLSKYADLGNAFKQSVNWLVDVGNEIDKNNEKLSKQSQFGAAIFKGSGIPPELLNAGTGIGRIGDDVKSGVEHVGEAAKKAVESGAESLNKAAASLDNAAKKVKEAQKNWQTEAWSRGTHIISIGQSTSDFSFQGRSPRPPLNNVRRPPEFPIFGAADRNNVPDHQVASSSKEASDGLNSVASSAKPAASDIDAMASSAKLADSILQSVFQFKNLGVLGRSEPSSAGPVPDLDEVANAAKPAASALDDAAKSAGSVSTIFDSLISAMRQFLSTLGSSSAPGGGIGQASGGLISGPSGTDVIPAMLTAGEYVMPVSAVQRFGVDHLEAIRTGQLSHFFDGGVVRGIRFNFASGGPVPSVSGPESMNLQSVVHSTTNLHLDGRHIASAVSREAVRSRLSMGGSSPGWYR